MAKKTRAAWPEPQKSRKRATTIWANGISALTHAAPFRAGRGRAINGWRANNTQGRQAAHGPKRQPGQGNRRGAAARATAQAVGTLRRTCDRRRCVGHCWHRRVPILRASPGRGSRGGRRQPDRGDARSGAEQERRGAEGPGRHRCQRAGRLCPDRALTSGCRRARCRQDGRGGGSLRGDRQGEQRRSPADRLCPAAGGHVETGRCQLDGHAELAQRSGC